VWTFIFTSENERLGNCAPVKVVLSRSLFGMLNYSSLDWSLFTACHSLFFGGFVQDVFESMGQFVDGLKFSGGSHSLMSHSYIKKVTDMARKHDIYVSTGDWGEHWLRKGPSVVKEYIEVTAGMKPYFFLLDCS